MSKEVEPSQVMHFLNELYEGFDELVDEYDMYKLDIVGDCYIVVAGLIKEDQDGFVCVDEMDEDQVTNNAVRIMQFAKAMLRESRPVLMPHNSEPVSLRIGIHTGPAVSGLVGAKMPKFTLFGDTIVGVGGGGGCGEGSRANIVVSGRAWKWRLRWEGGGGSR